MNATDFRAGTSRNLVDLPGCTTLASRGLRVTARTLAAMSKSVASSLLLLALTACASQQAIAVRKGDPHAFAGAKVVCVFGSDTDSEADVAAEIGRELEARLPPVRVSPLCGDGLFVSVQYSSGFAACTHCEPGTPMPRFSGATIQLRTVSEIFAEGEWSDLRGGSPEKVARRFAIALASLLAPRPGSPSGR